MLCDIIQCNAFVYSCMCVMGVWYVICDCVHACVHMGMYVIQRNAMACYVMD